MAIRTTTISKCPHCGNELGFETQTGLNKLIRIDIPIGVCYRCGNKYIDPNKNEWIFMNQKERNEYLAYGENGRDPIGSGALVILTLLMWYLLISFASVGDSVTIPLIFSLLFTVWCYFYFGKKLIKLIKIKNNTGNYTYDNNIKNSLQRCNNPNYLKELKIMGFNIYAISDNELRDNDITDLIQEIENKWEVE